MPSAQTNSCGKWSVVFACCFINFILDGIGRLVGIFFVASLEEFPGAGRQLASLPYSLGTAIRNLSGPLAGLLAKQYGIRNVTLCGAILSALGIGLCFFATNILWIAVLWGGIFGIGYSFGNILLPAAITEVFQKNQATATGISFSGACLGSFCLPSLFSYILECYGLRGLFLITASLVLHCIPASLLLQRRRSSRPLLQTLDNIAKSNNNVNIQACQNVEVGPTDSDCSSGMFEVADDCSDIDVPASQKTVTSLNSLKSVASNKDVLKETTSDPSGKECNGNLTKKPLVLRVSVVECTFTCDSRFPSVPMDFEDPTVQRNSYRARSVPVGFYDNSTCVCEGDDIFEPNKLNASFNKENHTAPLASKDYKINKPENGECVIIPEITSVRHGSVAKQTLDATKTEETKLKNKLLGSLRIFGDQCFLIVTTSMAAYEFVFIAVITVAVDFSNDLRISQDNTKWIFMAFSVGDLLGRLCFGWITDKKIMSRNCFTALCFLGMTGTLLGMSISDGFPSLLGCFGAFGVFESGTVIMFPLLMVQCIQPEFHTIAIASSNLFPGIAALAVSPAVGYFRDHIGSYLGLFYILGAVSVISSILCLSLPHVASRRQTQSQR